MSLTGNLAAEERFAWIRQRLARDGRVSIAQAADELGVSEMTIRRDLAELEALGLARRVRGGAVNVAPESFEARHGRATKAKVRIAAKLTALVPSSGAICIDASSTMLRLAGAIETARGLTVVTNGVETFRAMQDKPGIDAVLTGGQLEPRTGSLVGPVACRAAGELISQRLFISAAAIDAEIGTSEACLSEAEVKRAMAAVADEVVLGVDSTKLDSRAMAVGLPWDRITTLVTELDPKDERLNAFRAVTEVV